MCAAFCLTATARHRLGLPEVDPEDVHQVLASSRRFYRAFDRLTTVLDPARHDRRARLPQHQADALAAAREDDDPERSRKRELLQEIVTASPARPRSLIIATLAALIRQDLPSPATISQEVQHVLAAARKIGTSILLVGHSSGAVVALESLVAAPGTFTGAVLYEPPVVIGPPLGGPGGEINIRARQAIAAGRPGRALRIFIRDTVRLPAWVAFLSGLFVALSPRLRLLVSHQIDDNEAIDQLGVRLDAYAGIDTPVLLLGGDRSPGHLSERLDALARALPRAERVVLRGQGHSAHAAAPAKVAAAIESFTAATTG
ncbi:alpha/beta hydrolase [Nonomuraea sp. NPDC046802]|uniref:alpha/beta fold hydrolase n=1 Tax=Nonomuraea sp. NPDC046802 TaxID=3154919 RepID=UPI0033F8CE03